MTGLTSNPTIFEKAIGDSDFYDAAIRRRRAGDNPAKRCSTTWRSKICQQAADLFRAVFDSDPWRRRLGVARSVAVAGRRHCRHHQAAARTCTPRAKRANLFIKIPGTPAGVPAIEESIFAGVPINVTMLFSREQYLAAAEAYLRGIERRIAAGLDPRVASVASLFVSRWDVAVHDKVPDALRNRLGIAMGRRVYKSYCDVAGVAALEKARGSRRAAAAIALGEHRNEGPGGRRHDVRRSAGGARYDQHVARKDPARVRRSWPRERRSCRATAAMRSRYLAEFARAGIDEVQLGGAAAA